MRRFTPFTPFLLALLLGACSSDSPTGCCSTGPATLRVVNAFTSPVDVVIDGHVAVAALPAGAIGLASADAGGHTLVLRQTGAATTLSQSITTTNGAVNTFAVLRASTGALSSAVLDDTNSVVPVGATKVRVLHLAPNGGTLQVYRTQPDYQQPVSWQFPFDYQAAPNSLSAPFYQSTVGTWEIRIWQTPVGAAGWSSASIRVVLPLASGEKKTILILDNPAGGVRTEIL